MIKIDHVLLLMMMIDCCGSVHCCQDPKVIIDLEQKGNGSLESRTVTICSGLDFVNINYTPMIARDPDTAKVGVVIISY